MKKFKKSLCIFLVVCMIIPMSSILTFAESTEPAFVGRTSEYTENILFFDNVTTSGTAGTFTSGGTTYDFNGVDGTQADAGRDDKYGMKVSALDHAVANNNAAWGVYWGFSVKDAAAAVLSAETGKYFSIHYKVVDAELGTMTTKENSWDGNADLQCGDNKANMPDVFYGNMDVTSDTWHTYTFQTNPTVGSNAANGEFPRHDMFLKINLPHLEGDSTQDPYWEQRKKTGGTTPSDEYFDVNAYYIIDYIGIFDSEEDAAAEAERWDNYYNCGVYADTEPGTYYESQSVSLTNATGSGDIYYTTDGTTPSAENGTKYTNAITLPTGKTTLKCVLIDGENVGAVATYDYYIAGSRTSEYTDNILFFDNIDTTAGTFTSGSTVYNFNGIGQSSDAGREDKYGMKLTAYDFNTEGHPGYGVFWFFSVKSDAAAKLSTTKGKYFSIHYKVMDAEQATYVFDPYKGSATYNKDLQCGHNKADVSSGTGFASFDATNDKWLTHTFAATPDQGDRMGEANYPLADQFLKVKLPSLTSTTDDTLMASRDFEGNNNKTVGFDLNAYYVIDYIGIFDSEEDAAAEAERWESYYACVPFADVESGKYFSNQTVKLTSSNLDADIYYTTDGTTPDNTDNLYTGAISVTETTSLKAVAYDKNSNTYSPVTAYEYVISNDRTQRFFVGNDNDSGVIRFYKDSPIQAGTNTYSVTEDGNLVVDGYHQYASGVELFFNFPNGTSDPTGIQYSTHRATRVVVRYTIENPQANVDYAATTANAYPFQQNSKVSTVTTTKIGDWYETVMVLSEAYQHLNYASNYSIDLPNLSDGAKYVIDYVGFFNDDAAMKSLMARYRIYDNQSIVLGGAQIKDDKTGIRFVGAIDDYQYEGYEEVGFKLWANGTPAKNKLGANNLKITKVYESIIAEDSVVTAEMLANAQATGKLFTFCVNDISANSTVTFKVCVYAKIGGVEVCGDIYEYTYLNGAFVQ